MAEPLDERTFLAAKRHFTLVWVLTFAIPLGILIGWLLIPLSQNPFGLLDILLGAIVGGIGGHLLLRKLFPKSQLAGTANYTKFKNARDLERHRKKTGRG